MLSFSPNAHTHFSFPQVQFQYHDPCPNFNRSSVKGPLAKLIRVKDVSTATALEVTAGGKVSRVVGNNTLCMYEGWPRWLLQVGCQSAMQDCIKKLISIVSSLLCICILQLMSNLVLWSNYGGHITLFVLVILECAFEISLWHEMRN